MKTITVNYLKKKVDIFLEKGLIFNLSAFIDNQRRYFIITDNFVASLYLDAIIKQMPLFDIYVLAQGESSKNYDEIKNILKEMLEANIQKNDCLIALGGGVVGDITGFVASIYKRGINFISIPTTLISQVDSCLGGKCGIDFSIENETYKNQIGSIYHPETIFIDPNLLLSLPKHEFSAGMSEVIKYGLCFSEPLLNKIMEDAPIADIIFDSLMIKAKITEQDEFDEGLRISLNFGHTIGHAIESLSQFLINHGQAVALGMYYETKQLAIREFIKTIYHKVGINLDFPFQKKDIFKFIEKDKKRRHEDITIPVLKEIGKIVIETMTFEEFFRGI
ncbi:MAG: 3-dehydroquinate synthase family protein [Bacilli bacterium]